jgi:hypothetical protein
VASLGPELVIWAAETGSPSARSQAVLPRPCPPLGLTSVLRDVPHPGQRLVATLLDDLQVAYLRARVRHRPERAARQPAALPPRAAQAEGAQGQGAGARSTPGCLR